MERADHEHSEEEHLPSLHVLQRCKINHLLVSLSFVVVLTCYLVGHHSDDDE